MALSQNELLKNWHLKLAILFGIITPTFTAAGAYYSLQGRISQVQSDTSEKIANIQLDSTKDYVSKEDFKAMSSDMRQMRDDVIEIKTLLHKKLR